MDKLVSKNRIAEHDYDIHYKVEAGVELLGWEVKSLRIYGVSLKNAAIHIKNNECWLLQTNMKNPIESKSNPDSDRPRKLLLRRSQINKLHGLMSNNNYVLIPLECYFKNSRYFKIVIGLCSKLKKYDKREKIKKREIARAREY